MSITINIYYTGKGDNAKKFSEEMIASGIVDDIRSEQGNLRYEYFYPFDDEKTILLIDSWMDQQSLDIHHNSVMMEKITQLREKYDLHMSVERYVRDDSNTSQDEKYHRP